MPGILLTAPAYTFNQPVNQNDRTVIHPERHRMRPRRYATTRDPSTTGELLLQAIKASA